MFGKSGRGALSPVITTVMLISVVLASAILAYSYFTFQAALAVTTQNIQMIISRLKFNTIIDVLHYYEEGDLTYYVVVRRIDANKANIIFTVVSGKFYDETLIVFSVPEVDVYLLSCSDGLYGDVTLSPFFTLSSESIYTSTNAPLYTMPTFKFDIYVVKANQTRGARGCDMLLRIVASDEPEEGQLVLLILTIIEDKYYLVDAHPLEGGG